MTPLIKVCEWMLALILRVSRGWVEPWPGVFNGILKLTSTNMYDDSRIHRIWVRLEVTLTQSIAGACGGDPDDMLWGFCVHAGAQSHYALHGQLHQARPATAPDTLTVPVSSKHSYLF